MPGLTPSEFAARQDSHLRGCALRADRDAGRAFPEPPHPYRTCFQRDRDRVVHCSAFRRLDYKTQVFVPHEADHHRTRLTHTLEVAQIARTLARALAANEDAAEAVALAHDLGHPPFGHTGEEALDALMADHGHFEHNRQGLRIVDFLEHPYPLFRGLNLTHAVRRCLARHTTRYDAPLPAEFDDAPSAPLEGQIVDAADEIAYTSADLADALAAEWIAPEDLAGEELWRRARRRAEETMPRARPIHKRISACRAVVAILADDLLAETERRIARSRPESPADVCAAGDKTVAFSAPTAGELASLQAFLMRRVYQHPKSLEHRERARRMIPALFAAYLADSSLLPRRYRLRIAREGAHRVICDYIAGMTDRFCTQEYRKTGSGE